MPTQEVITDRLKALEAATSQSRADLETQFKACLSTAQAMDRFGMELAETEFFGRLVHYALRNEDHLPGVLAHQEACVLRGDWQPVSPCAMHRALHQAQSLARCKFIKRLREVLNDGTD
jgi:hypothetical protein